MKVLLLAFSILTLTTQQCAKKMHSTTLPACIQQKIDSIKAQPRWNPPAEVWEYTYNGKRVFLVSADCCDQYTTLYDDKCNYVCAPSGGLTGTGDRKCDDFNATAKQVRLVWKDSR